MADSSARKLNLESRKTQSKSSTPKAIVLDPDNVPYTFFEKMLFTCCSIVTIVLLTFIVSASISQTNAQHSLSDAQKELVSSQNQNTTIKQEIGELTSSSRMDRIAKQQGLTLNENNIRTIR